MAARLSTGLINSMANIASLADSLAGCSMDIYSGTQPTTADMAATGTLLCTVTQGSAAVTNEVRSVGSVTIAGSAGSINTITLNALDILGGAVAFVTDAATTAVAVAAKINANKRNRTVTASATGLSGVITLTGVTGFGSFLNGQAVSGSGTTMTVGTPVTMAGGVDQANGLHFGTVSAGVLSKVTSETWSATVLATGTAGWFRIRESGDNGQADSTTAARYDGSIASSGAQMNLAVQTLSIGAPFTVPSGSITLASS